MNDELVTAVQELINNSLAVEQQHGIPVDWKGVAIKVGNLVTTSAAQEDGAETPIQAVE